MITEDENWREKFSEKNESAGRDGYRPQYGSENNSTPRYSSQGRVMRPRISRPAFSSNTEGHVSRPYQSREGGYQQRPRYNAGGEGGYQPRQPREGGYHPRQQGGYQPRQQGGYRPRYNAGGEGGYQQRPRREGGYQSRQGGYAPKGGPRGGGYRPRTAGYNPNAKYSMKKQIEYKETHIDPEEPIRLNKFLANAGVCSRREADSFIEAGVVSVNGQVVTELGTKIKRSDSVLFHDQLVSSNTPVVLRSRRPTG